jgi:hypothetical protein
MKLLWVALACLIVALMMRFGHVAENQLVTYRTDESVYAIAFNTVAFWLLLGIASLLGMAQAVQRVRAR